MTFLLVSEASRYLADLPQVPAGPMNVTLQDVVVLVLAQATAARFRRAGRPQLALLLVAGVIGLGLLRSFAVFGVGGADMEFRPEVSFIVGSLYATTLSPTEIGLALRRVMQLCLVMGGIAIYRWLSGTTVADPDTAGSALAGDRPLGQPRHCWWHTPRSPACDCGCSDRPSGGLVGSPPQRWRSSS